MAFYWVRWLPREGASVPIFLPGFKADKLVRVAITADPAAAGPQWRALLRYPALEPRRESTATALTSPDRHLLQLAFEVHAVEGSARGQIEQAGCEGATVMPSDQHLQPADVR